MRKLFVLVPALTLATTTSVLAQARFQQTVEVKVKPGHERAYESYLKKVIEAADKIKSPLGWNTFFVAVGKQSPTYASWLNQVEIFFSIVQRKVLTPNDFSALDDIPVHLSEFERYYEEIARPFQWKFTRKDLKQLMKRLAAHEPRLASAA